MAQLTLKPLALLVVAVLSTQSQLVLSSGQQEFDDAANDQGVVRTWLDDRWKDPLATGGNHGDDEDAGPINRQELRQAINDMSLVNRPNCGYSLGFSQELMKDGVVGAFQCDRTRAPSSIYPPFIPGLRGGGSISEDAVARFRSLLYKPVDSKNRIAGGVTVDKGFFPSYVHILTRFSQLANTSHFGVITCGGILVTPNVVVTAAHCLIFAEPGYKRSKIIARYGLSEYDKYEFETDALGYCIHDKYAPMTDTTVTTGDLAVLIMRKSVEFGPYIQPACLSFQKPPLKNRSCFVVGMGLDEKQTQYPKSKLKKLKAKNVQIPILLGSDKTITCYRSEEGNACRGDSGSAVYCMDTCLDNQILPRQYAVGVASFVGHKVCGKDEPSFICASDIYKQAKDLTDLIGSCRSKMIQLLKSS